jgi:hypothetical protein
MILRNLELLRDYCESCRWIEAADKSVHCANPTDLLIDDNPHEVAAWRVKSGVAFWWDVGKPGIFEEFKNFWRLDDRR